tara:strand:+ start:49 stop:480 length:432 start_codon:yes stop_codon:yes gene_type:complete
MSEVKNDVSGQEIVDISGEELIKHNASIAMGKRIANRIQAMIELIMRQTDYTEEEAGIKLEHWNNNYLLVIKEYMDPNFQDKEKTPAPSSTKNQMIYGEIRNFMDDVNKQQLQRKRRTEQVEQKKAAYMAYMNKLQKEAKENK